MITSRSLYKSNVLFVFKDAVSPPENHEITGLYTGDVSGGVQLVDDPMMRMKILDVPQRGLQIAWETKRLRIDDMRAVVPDESILIEEAVRIYETLCAPRKMALEAIGFNLEIYYQTKEVIQIQSFFDAIMTPLYIGDALLDFGWQWTVSEKNGTTTHGYFSKVTAPLEFVLHHNAHFIRKEMPSRNELQELFRTSFETTHAVAAGLKL